MFSCIAAIMGAINGIEWNIKADRPQRHPVGPCDREGPGWRVYGVSWAIDPRNQFRFGSLGFDLILLNYPKVRLPLT